MRSRAPYPLYYWWCTLSIVHQHPKLQLETVFQPPELWALRALIMATECVRCYQGPLCSQSGWDTNLKAQMWLPVGTILPHWWCRRCAALLLSLGDWVVPKRGVAIHEIVHCVITVSLIIYRNVDWEAWRKLLKKWWHFFPTYKAIYKRNGRLWIDYWVHHRCHSV